LSANLINDQTDIDGSVVIVTAAAAAVVIIFA